eukprot:jgi/Mesvir1/18755/Mv01261-RA.1
MVMRQGFESPGIGRFKADDDAALPEAVTLVIDGPEKPLSSFFSEMGQVKSDMAMMRRNLQKLQKAHEQSKAITHADQMKKLREQMQDDIEEVSKAAKGVKDRLDALDKQNLEARKQPGQEEGSSQDRTRTALVATNRKKLKELMGEFQDLRQRFQDEYKEVVERRYFTVTGQKPDEETLDTLIETGDSEAIFRKAIAEQGRGRILDTVAEIQERHDAIKELERQMLGLYQIFLDMSVLVDQQGEMLDNIEKQVAKSIEYVHAGTEALQKVKKLQKGYRKWMCCAVIILLIVVLVLVVGVFKPWKSGKA